MCRFYAYFFFFRTSFFCFYFFYSHYCICNRAINFLNPHGKASDKKHCTSVALPIPNALGTPRCRHLATGLLSILVRFTAIVSSNKEKGAFLGYSLDPVRTAKIYALFASPSSSPFHFLLNPSSPFLNISATKKFAFGWSIPLSLLFPFFLSFILVVTFRWGFLS